MSSTNEALKEQFMERYTNLKLFEQFLLTEIKILESLSTSSATDSTQTITKVMTTISQHEIYNEDFKDAKQIADSFLNNEISSTVAIARLNYLYDLSTFKSSHMWLIQDIFKCYF